jgi:1-deoxy-D-xylulose-5-phosphate reductoisomerase
VIAAGGSSGATFNAANEIAVAAFLERRIGFLEIAELVRDTLDATPLSPVRSLDDVLEADKDARARARAMVRA